MKHVVITGVSSGIGKSIALELLKSEYFVIGTVRNKSDSVHFMKNILKINTLKECSFFRLF
jgi:NAD(P)-dependent dehydrogenase (short-subunit alcohol dehydrogenase family)